MAKQVKPVPTGTAPLRASAAASRSNAAARRMLRKLVQGEAPPTAPMSIVERLAGSPYANPMIQAAGIDASARITLDFALDVAETMFRYGAGALEVETSIIAVTAAFGLSDIDVDITNQSVLINYAKPDTVPITVMRVVRSWTNNYAGLSLVHELVTDIVNGGVGRSEAKERLQEITSRPKPFPRWMAIGAGGVFSGAIVAFLGGSIFAALVGSIATLLMGLVGKKLSKWRMPDFFITGIGACLATVIALLFWALHVPLSPSLVIAGGILFLLPTGRLVSATQDAINGFPVTASGRYLSAFFTFAAIAAGVAVGLVGGTMTGISLPEVFVQGEGSYPYVVRALLLMVATMAICMTEQTKLNMLLPTAAVGLAGLLIYDFVLWAGIGDRIAPAVGAVVIGFLGRIVGLRMGSPQLVVAVPAVLFLLPGLSVFRSIYRTDRQRGGAVQWHPGAVRCADRDPGDRRRSGAGRQLGPPVHQGTGIERKPAGPASVRALGCRQGCSGKGAGAGRSLGARRRVPMPAWAGRIGPGGLLGRAPKPPVRAPNSPVPAGSGPFVLREDLPHLGALLRLESVFGPAIGPVAGDRDLVAGQSVVLEQDVPERLHLAALAMDEGIHPALGPLQGGDSVTQHGCGPGRLSAAEQPVDLQACRGVQFLDVVLGIHFQEGVAAGVWSQGLDGGRDGGKRRIVAGEQVPVGVGVGTVGAAGAVEHHPVARLGPRGPRSGEAFLAMDHKVDHEFALLTVHSPHRVGAGDGQLVGRQRFLEFRDIDRELHVQGRIQEENLDVRIRRLLRRIPLGKRIEGVPAGIHADHVL